MQLIGMLDSPYVRRVAVSMQLLGLPFTHRALSVFRNYEEYRAINPSVKAPSFICDDGMVLTDSALILDYVETVAGKSLMPTDLKARQRELRILGFALAASEKSIQWYYEHTRRAVADAQWLERVEAQLAGAADVVEAELARQPLACERETITQAGITAAITWNFIQLTTPEALDLNAYPHWRAFTEQAERLPEFQAAPYGNSTYVTK